MFRMLMRTQNDFVTCVVRVGVGAIMYPHGAQKALGMYGGKGIEATVKMFSDSMQIPAWQAYGVIAAEFLGAIALMLGFMGRVAALGVIAVMAGAIHLVHGKNGFFLSNAGYEYNALIIVAAFVVLVRGSGALSIDRMLSGKGAPDTAAVS